MSSPGVAAPAGELPRPVDDEEGGSSGGGPLVQDFDRSVPVGFDVLSHERGVDAAEAAKLCSHVIHELVTADDPAIGLLVPQARCEQLAIGEKVAALECGLRLRM